MSEKELLETLRKEFEMSTEQFAPVWRRLLEQGRIEDYRSDETYTLKDLLDDAKEIMDEGGTGPGRRAKGGRKPLHLRERFEVGLSDYARERAAALSDALALEAASFPAVRAFREKVLEGRLLSPEQVRGFVASPAVRLFRREWFRDWGIPVVGHEARIVATHRGVPEFDWLRSGFEHGFDEDVHGFFVVRVEPPGVEKSVLYAHPADAEVPDGLSVDKQYTLNTVAEDGLVRPAPKGTLRYFDGGRIRQTWMLPGSLLDDLRGLVDLLVGRYGWSQEEAVQFVLAGKKPEVRPLKVSANLLTGHRGSPPVWHINLEAAPWVNATEVAEAYRGIQQQILRGDSGKGHLSPKKIALFRFVMEQSGSSDDEPDWEKLLETWNRRHADGPWHYGETKTPSHRKNNFKRDFDNAARELLDPKHHFPRRKVTTDLEEGQERDLQGRRAAAEAASESIEARLKLKEDTAGD